MSEKVTHIIHKLNLEIEVPDERLAKKMYSQAGSLLLQYVLPKLEELLKQYDRDDLHIRLEHLNIDLAASGSASLEEMIKEQLAQAIGKELQSRINDANDDSGEKRPVKVSGAESIVEAFLSFLEHGYLPWWIEEREVLSRSQDVIDAIAASEERFVAAFVTQLQRNPAVLETLIAQYDAVLLTYLFSLVASLELFSIVVEYESFFTNGLKRSRDAQLLKLLYWQKVWILCSIRELHSISGEDMRSKLVNMVREAEVLNASADVGELSFTDMQHSLLILKDTEDSEMLTLPDEMKVRDDDLTAYEDGLLGRNAGLILLHPFLQYFFKEFDLLDGDYFKNKRSCGIAVHLLHYLATGKENVPDFDLLFEKYLCGMKSNQITNRYIRLTHKMKSEADGLLQSVIRHWSVLKNTSTEGLQESFLQRKGKLIIKENSHKIIMEQSGLDILLQQIPWNISLVKFPWMKQLIHVEWAS